MRRRSTLLASLAAVIFALPGRSVFAADTLTILWAEWDPANYLQELVKDYEKQSGVKVVVETVPWFPSASIRMAESCGGVIGRIDNGEVTRIEQLRVHRASVRGFSPFIFHQIKPS